MLPTWASSLGDHRFDDRWEDQSLTAIEAGHVHDQQALERLRAIDRASLSPADQINFDLYARNLQTAIDGYKFRFFLCPLSQQGGVQDADSILHSIRITTPKDYENWLSRLEKLPALIAQNTTLMREGVKEHILWPKVVMNRIPAQIAKQLVDQPEDSPFYKPFKSLPRFHPRRRTRRARHPGCRRDPGKGHPRLPRLPEILHRRIPPRLLRSGRRVADAQRRRGLRFLRPPAHHDGPDPRANPPDRSGRGRPHPR